LKLTIVGGVFDVVKERRHVNVRTDSPPQVWVTPIIAAFTAFFIVDFLVSYRNPLFLLMSVITWPLILAALMRGLTTRLSNHGVSQITPAGHRHLAWTEVEQVLRNRGTYWVVGKGRRLYLWPALFEDPAAARAYIQKHLSAVNAAGDG
jgi:hypothetical protein